MGCVSFSDAPLLSATGVVGPRLLRTPCASAPSTAWWYELHVLRAPLPLLPCAGDEPHGLRSRDGDEPHVLLALPLVPRGGDEPHVLPAPLPLGRRGFVALLALLGPVEPLAAGSLPESLGPAGLPLEPDCVR